MSFQSELQGQDFLEATGHDVGDLKVIVCSETQNLLKSMRQKFGSDLRSWENPSGNSHGEILVRELLMKIKNQWNFPYHHDELCHCRKVRAHVVDQAIIAGAHTTEQVSRKTMAGTGCGTCRTDTENILKFRLYHATEKATETPELKPDAKGPSDA